MTGSSYFERSFFYLFFLHVSSNTSFLYSRLGEHDTTKNEGSEVERGIARIVKHPGYDSKTYTNDLALLQLYDGGVKYNNYVKPVCLAEKDVPAGSYCWITGKIKALSVKYR